MVEYLISDSFVQLRHVVIVGFIVSVLIDVVVDHLEYEKVKVFLLTY